MNDSKLMREADRALLNPPNSDPKEDWIDNWLNSESAKEWVEDKACLLASAKDVVWEHSGRRIICGFLFEDFFEYVKENTEYYTLADKFFQAMLEKNKPELKQYRQNIIELLHRSAKQFINAHLYIYAEWLYEKEEHDFLIHK
jgi:hypothetical protein